MVSACNYYNRFFEPFIPQIFVDEIEHFTTTLSYQRDYVDLCLTVVCNHSKQCTFTHATARKNAHALPFAHSQTGIDYANAGDKRYRAADPRHSKPPEPQVIERAIVIRAPRSGAPESGR